MRQFIDILESHFSSDDEELDAFDQNLKHEREVYQAVRELISAVELELAPEDERPINYDGESREGYILLDSYEVPLEKIAALGRAMKGGTITVNGDYLRVEFKIN